MEYLISLRNRNRVKNEIQLKDSPIRYVEPIYFFYLMDSQTELSAECVKDYDKNK